MHETLCALFLSTAILAATQSSGPSDWVGVWQAELDGQPSTILTLATDDGSLQGTLVLNGISREGGEPHIAVQETHVLLHPTLNGKTLSFAVKGIRRSNSTMKFTVEQSSSSTAQIHCLDCGERCPGSRNNQTRLASAKSMRGGFVFMRPFALFSCQQPCWLRRNQATPPTGSESG